MKKIIFALTLAACSLNAMALMSPVNRSEINLSGSLSIKIKNDLNDEVRVYNAGSGGSYSLTKGATTTIKMDVGDKLYYYNNGKKGDLILVASVEMDGKVQLLSKL